MILPEEGRKYNNSARKNSIQGMISAILKHSIPLHEAINISSLQSSNFLS